MWQKAVWSFSAAVLVLHILSPHRTTTTTTTTFITTTNIREVFTQLVGLHHDTVLLPRALAAYLCQRTCLADKASACFTA